MAKTGIEVFQNLHLKQRTELARIREAILAKIRDGWRHDAAAEARIKGTGLEDGGVIALVRDPFDGIDESGLVLWPEADGYRLANIVPKSVGELKIVEYNAILQDFVQQVAQPAAPAGEFDIHLSSPQEALTDWVSEAAAAALRRFSVAANKSTGSAHPMDRERWYAFLILVRAVENRLDTNKLIRWLTEVEGWPEEIAHDLAIEYEFGTGLLERYDSSGS